MRKQVKAWKALGAGLLALSTGCATPKYLVSDTFIAGRDVKYILTPAGQTEVVSLGGQKKEELYNFVVRICDYTPQDQETACADSTVVANVIPGSIY